MTSDQTTSCALLSGRLGFAMLAVAYRPGRSPAAGHCLADALT